MSKNLSSKTLFHFTRDFKFLTNILKNGIYIRYSLETYGKLLKSKSELVLPMSCFCDIPLSQISDHTKKYGTYSIGLSKEWGVKNGLSPVLYAHSKSQTSNILNSLTSDLTKMLDIEESDENRELLEDYGVSESDLDWYNSGKKKAGSLIEKRNEELASQLGHFLKYIKPYEGLGYSNGKEFTKVRFYDEREWRYVPPKKLLEKVELKDIYKREFYTNPIKRRYINIKLATHKKLTFIPSDIKFIIVSNEDEIPKMIKELRAIYEDKCTVNELMILNSRIISLEQIIDDL